MNDDDMDDRSDPDKRHCDSDVFNGRCVARVSEALILISEKREIPQGTATGQAGAGLEANLPYRLSLGNRICRPRFEGTYLG
jgi:hypothetical protein